MALLQRKYIDLIHSISSKWVNWDPPIEVRVGSFGTVDKETGDLSVEGNIYDPEFQRELDKDVRLSLANNPPREGPVEDDFIIATRGAKHRDLSTDSGVDIPGIATASIKGQWVFEEGKRDAVLIMHNPRQIYIPSNVVLEPLYRVEKLTDKQLVTSIHICPAYSLYLSNKSGERLTLALTAAAPIAGVVGVTANAGAGLSWHADGQSGLLRKGCDQQGNNAFTPLYALKRPAKRGWRFWRDGNTSEPSGDDLWHDVSPSWDPLDDDGVEDPIDTPVKLGPSNPFGLEAADE